MSHRRAVLLDRDGTIIVERHYLSDPEQVELIPGVAAALRELRELGLELVLVTNQSAVGRGMLSERHLGAIHGRLSELLRSEGIELDGLYYCPHTPDDGCRCRKPQPGLVERAARDLGFELSRSFLIGDKRSDLELGRRIGAVTFLVRTGYGAEVEAERGDMADYVVDTLVDAVPMIDRLIHPQGVEGARVRTNSREPS